MLSLNDIEPKGRAASIDSGYGSTIPENDQTRRLRSSNVSWPKQVAQLPIGLGISGLGDIHIDDQLRLRRPESPVDPVTTRLNVYTVKANSIDNHYLPSLGEDAFATCVTCQVRILTKEGDDFTCHRCRKKDSGVLLSTKRKCEPPLAVSRPNIPTQTGSKGSIKSRSEARCSACELAYKVDPVSSACQSCTPDLDCHSKSSPKLTSTVKRSCAKRSTKLPSRALQHLRDWLRNNRDHPYPTAETKRALAQECGITEKQVTTWFTNTRARKLGSPNDPSRLGGDHEGPEDSDHSNVANTPIFATSPAIGYDTPMSIGYSPVIAGPSNYDPASLALQTSRRGKKKDYRRMNTMSPIDNPLAPQASATLSRIQSGQQEMWQCTFCPKQLVPKSWRRHEETQHRPKYQWICHATEPRLTTSSRAGIGSICAFCSIKNPSEDHFLHAHRITECSKKAEGDRTFGRPDHLRQHMKNFHKTSLSDLVRDKWRRDGPGKNVNEGWVCGFCKAELKTWDIREAHIANHFKDGMTMAAWEELPQPMPQPIDDDGRLPSADQHSALFSRMQDTLTNHPNRQAHAHAPSSGRLPNRFESLPASRPCATIAPAPVMSQMPEYPLNTFMPSDYMAEFNFSAPSTTSNFDAMYPVTNSAYETFQGDGNLQVDFNTLTNPEFYGNLGDFQGIWNQGQQ